MRPIIFFTNDQEKLKGVGLRNIFFHDIGGKKKVGKMSEYVEEMYSGFHDEFKCSIDSYLDRLDYWKSVAQIFKFEVKARDLIEKYRVSNG